MNKTIIIKRNTHIQNFDTKAPVSIVADDTLFFFFFFFFYFSEKMMWFNISYDSSA